jgi:predicted nucleic acid-binding protein
MIVLDTTVLVYAKGADHPLRAPCRELIAALASGELAGAFDAVLAAAAIEIGASALVSADAAFGVVSAVTHVTPDAAGVASLLGG